MEALSHVDIADKPVIGLDDIVSYNSTNHEITLTENGIKNITSLQVPTSGKSFLVCVNRSPIYWGAFWTPISSQSFSGVTIEIPLLSGQEARTISINLGYPAESFYRGEDPRNNITVMESLKESGKLVTIPDNPLPHSFKGYELYSWQQDNQWNYTLITGTNRDKTVEEIITGNNTVCRWLGKYPCYWRRATRSGYQPDSCERICHLASKSPRRFVAKPRQIWITSRRYH